MCSSRMNMRRTRSRARRIAGPELGLGHRHPAETDRPNQRRDAKLKDGTRRQRYGSADAAPTDDLQQHDHDGDHEQHMDEPAHGDGADQPEQPKNDEHDSEGVEHIDGQTAFAADS